MIKLHEAVPDIDVDVFRFTVTAGQTVDFDIDTTQNGAGGVNSYLSERMTDVIVTDAVCLLPSSGRGSNGFSSGEMR